MASPAEVRIVATDMKIKVAAYKVALDAVDTVVAAWSVIGADGTLPADEIVKAQLLAYEALSKPGINMSDALAAVRIAT